MAYEELGSVDTVTLGGVDKATGKKNPTEIEGYLVEVQKRPNKFKPNDPQNFYVFQTQSGMKGVYAKAGIDSVLKGAQLGAMTKLVATNETLDTGKGFPMKVFKGYQDKTNTVEVTAYSSIPTSHNNIVDEDQTLDDYGMVSEPVMERPTRPSTPAKPPSAERQAEVQALLSGARRSK